MARSNQAMEDLLRYNAAILPQKRSVFSKNHSHATTLDAGDLVPVMWDRVLPGDEKKIRLSALCRMATPIHPVMDEATISFWAFYVPDRLWWKNAKAFYGENLDASFNPDGEYQMPSLNLKQYLVDKAHSDDNRRLNDYFGFPVAHGDLDNVRYENFSFQKRVTAGLHRSYQLIWNEYYRNSSIQPALQLNDGDIVSDAEWSVISQLRKVNKLPDMFTSLLREPQAGDDVLLPLGEWAPVVTRDASHDTDDLYPATFYSYYNESDLRWVDEGDYLDAYIPYLSGGTFGLSNQVDADGGGFIRPVPANLWADLTAASSSSINNLRAAITIQQLLETDAIAGKRYQNILQAHFGVFTPDATLQRPEYLGGTKTPIGMRQVLQTGATVDGVSPQGNAAAVSVTNLSNEWVCNKAFTEPGFIMVLAAVRTSVSYSQGLNPLLTKLDRYDHYWPVFENLGNQPVYHHELYGDIFSTDGAQILNYNDILGYKEAWQEYRMISNRVSGLFRPDVDGTLASWNYSLNLTGTESLNSAFIEQNSTPVERTIAVTSEPQFLLDTYFEYTDIKNMGVHSIPGLTRL